MRHTFTATYQKRGNWYVAWVEEIPGVNTQGRTLKEAKTNLRDALRSVLKANRDILKRDLKTPASKREHFSITLTA